MLAWTVARDFLREAARADLDGKGEVRPCLAAFCGDRAAFVAFVRPFAKGGYADPLIELLAAAGGIGADRLALSIAGRAWSMNDPVSPVVPGAGDLRQRVLCLFLVQADETAEVVHPFDIVDGAVRWGEPLQERSSGWIPQALQIAARCVDELRAPAFYLISQLER